MSGTVKKWAVWVALAVVCIAAGVGFGFAYEAYRTSQRAAKILEEELADKPADTKELSESLQRLTDPAEFQKFCEKVRERNISMGNRSSSLTHCEKRIDQDFDAKGESMAVEEELAKVWTDSGKEKRIVLQKKAQGKVHRIGNPKYVYPLSKFAGLEAYDCKFDGTETIDGKLAVRIRFTAKEPVAGKLSGWLWVDPDDYEPRRFEGLAVKPPPFVDRLKMVVSYASAENSENQIRSVRSEARIPVMRRTRRVEVDFSKYETK